MYKATLAAVVLALSSLLAPLAVQAAPVTLIAEGVFFEHFDPDRLLPFDTPTPGTTYQLTVTFETTGIDTISFDPGVGAYPVILDMQLRIGGVDIGQPGPQGDRAILVFNDLTDESGAMDQWVAARSTGFPLVSTLSLELRGGAHVLADDSLIVPPWPGSWSAGRILYGMYEPGEAPDEFVERARSVATVTSITAVPGPGTAWLLGTGIAAIGWWRRSGGRRRTTR